MVFDGRRFSSTILLTYAGPAIVLSTLNLALVVYVPAFYATEMGMSLGAIGLAFFVARAWDAFLDPVMGMISDRTTSRWGARKPWVLIGTPLLAVSTWALFAPPTGAGSLYLTITIFTYYAAWTMVQIPYLSWGAELTADYRERNRIVGFREGATFLGVLLATAFPLLIFRNAEPTIAQILETFIWLTVGLFPVLVIFAVVAVPRGQIAERADVPSLKVTTNTLKQNKPYLLLILTTFLIWLGVNIYNAAILMIVEFSAGLAKGAFLSLVLVQFFVGILLVPFIVRAANKVGKHRVLAFSAIGVSVTLPMLILVPHGSYAGAVMVFALLGVAISPIWVLPTALIADAADYAMLKGGTSDVGLYMAIYNFSLKLSLALSVGISLPVIQFLGFDPTDPMAGNVWGLDFVGLLAPAVLLLPAAFALLRYPINQKRHDLITKRIHQQQTRRHLKQIHIRSES